jgi:hypothetical protein
MDNDVDQLRLLSIFHYVVGGIAALFSLFPLIHVALGLAMISGRLDGNANGPDVYLFGWLFVAFAGIAIVSGITLAVCLILAGHFLSQHTLHVLPGRRRDRMHFHALWDGPRRLHNHRASAAKREAAVWLIRQTFGSLSAQHVGGIQPRR